jgi:hypothetical protein
VAAGSEKRGVGAFDVVIADEQSDEAIQLDSTGLLRFARNDAAT